MPRRQAIVVVPSIPTPDVDSGSKSVVDLVRHLQDGGWSVTIYGLQPAPDPRYAAALQATGVAVLDMTGDAFDDVISHVAFDLAILCFWHTAELCIPVIRLRSPGTRIIVDSMDLHFIRESRRLAGSPTPQLTDGPFAAAQRSELDVYAAADGVLTRSRKESALLETLMGDSIRAYVQQDCDESPRLMRPPAERHGILFVGSFRHSPNVEAVTWLLTEVVRHLSPALLERHPIHIVGSGMSPELQALRLPGVPLRMIGWVPAVEPYYEHARVSVLPLLNGAGTKRKLLQAMVVGTPVVTTSVGAEGFDIEAGEHALVVDDAPGFAAAITRVLDDDELWQRLARSARDRILRDYGRQPARDQALATVADVLARDPKGPSLPIVDLAHHRRRQDAQYQAFLDVSRRAAAGTSSRG